MERFIALFGLWALIVGMLLLIPLFFWRRRWGKQAVKRNRRFQCAKCARKLLENDGIYIKSIERSRHPSVALDADSKYALANYDISLRKSTFRSTDMGEIVVIEPLFGFLRVPHKRMRIILCDRCGRRAEKSSLLAGCAVAIFVMALFVAVGVLVYFFVEP